MKRIIIAFVLALTVSVTFAPTASADPSDPGFPPGNCQGC